MVTLKPSNSGQFDAPRAKAPCTFELGSPTPALRKEINAAEVMSVAIPAINPRGMSFLGSADSSAANGSCSIAKNNHTANGKVIKIPFQPSGNQEPPPSGSSTVAPVAGSTPTFSAHR